MRKANALAVARDAAAKARAGTITYQQQDCQAFVEGCVAAAGGQMDYAGSNDMFRNACAWLGTLEEAKALGYLRPGALLFIHAHDGGEPAKYKADGKGNASHVGLYCGVDGVEAAHSSASRGRVCASTLKNAWTHAGWAWEIEAEDGSGDESAPAGEGSMAEKQGAVWSADGNPVKLRQTPGTEKPYLLKVPVGTAVTVLETGAGADGVRWSKVRLASGQTGYMMAGFLLAKEGAEAVAPESALAEMERLLAELSERVTVLEEGRG